MAQASSRSSWTFVATLAVLVLVTTAAFAAQPTAGKFHWQHCSPGGPCPAATIDFSVKTKKGHPSKIKGFVYNNGFACGVVSVRPSIKVDSKGRFSFSGHGKNPGGQRIPLTISGQFASSKKALGTLIIHASCATADPLYFTAKHVK